MTPPAIHSEAKDLDADNIAAKTDTDKLVEYEDQE